MPLHKSPSLTPDAMEFRADGRKELIALVDGYRESVESWADLLRDCARRGMRGR